MPTRTIALLIGIGLLDLVMTAWLHYQGLIVEMNPLMKGIIENSEWHFVLVKGATLVVSWWALAWYARTNMQFVRKACLYGAGLYSVVWLGWFLVGTYMS